MGKWRGGIYTRSPGNGLVSRFVQLCYLHVKLFISIFSASMHI